LLADKLDDIVRGTESRAAVVGEVKRKKRASSAKKSRRKYRKLEEEKAAAAGQTLGKEEALHDRDYDEESFGEEETGLDSSDEKTEMPSKR
jgi:peptide chain release factor